MEEKITTARIQTRAVHAGDRKPLEGFVPVTVPIYTAASYIYSDIAQLDKVFGHEAEGPSYARYNNPTNDALEAVMASLESGLIWKMPAPCHEVVVELPDVVVTFFSPTA